MCTKKLLFLWFCLCLIILCLHVTTAKEDEIVPSGTRHLLVKRAERQTFISTEFGQVSGASASDGNETFNVQFITLEPNSLFLPVMLHQDMVFYVHTGSGKLSYKDEHKRENVTLKRGDVYRLESGTVFFIQSDLDPTRQKLRIYAIFGNVGEDLREPSEYGPYSSIRDLVLGFDEKVLKETFKVPDEVMEEIISGRKPEAIVHGLPSTKKTMQDKEIEFIESIFGSRSTFAIFETINKDKKKSNLFNIFHEKRDFENCNGWSTTVNQKKYSVLKNSRYGLFMVNLTHGGMMGPHWNPKATEIAIVLQGKGMVRVVCPNLPNQIHCKNERFEAEEGDVFVVPRFHPMAQMAFNNKTFVFMGFSTSTKNNHPQYLAGKASVLRTLDKHILATSFGVNETTFDRLVNQQGESVILECTSCAEEEWRIMEEEIEREREEARQREEEETRRKEEERRRQEEEAKRKEEEEAKRQEEQAARKREEEERKKKEQEEARRKKEEEAERERREQEERERQQPEEAARERREQEERQRQQQEEEARERREQEEREAKQREAERREQEERKAAEAAERTEQEEREARQREEEEAQIRREQEEREQEQARQAEREREAAARKEEEAARQQEEEARRQQEGGQGGGEQPPEEEGRQGGEGQREEEAAKQQEEEMGKEQEQGSDQGWGRRILKRHLNFV